MKRLRNFFAYLIIVVAALMFFIPKVNLYYQAEHELKPYGVIVSDERVFDRGFWVDIADATVFVQGIESATADRTRVLLLGVFNQIEIDGIALGSALQQFVPQEIERVVIRHTVLDPLHVTFEAFGDFGMATARVSVLDRQVHAIIEPSTLMSSRFEHTLRTLKQDETGGYIYESRF